jgi:hypothetical protein
LSTLLRNPFGQPFVREDDGSYRAATPQEAMSTTATEAPKSGSHNTHARLAPSDAKRWTNCTASLAYQEANADRIPPDTGSIYADEGTKAHDYAAEVLDGLTGIDDIPEDFRPHIGFYVDHCLALGGKGVEVFVESKVPLFYDPDSTGTADFAAISEGRIEIRDLKYGAGVLVEAEANEQLAIYALSFVENLISEGLHDFGDETTVCIGIVQPRHHGEDPVRLWELPLHELREFCRPIEYRAIQIREGRGLEFRPSDGACRWCACKAFCEARIKWMTEALESAPGGDPLDLLSCLPDLPSGRSKEGKAMKDDPEAKLESRTPGLAGVPDADLVAIWNNRKNIAAWLDDIEELFQKRVVENGEHIEGLKVVMGREGNREWADESAADTFLAPKIKADERYTKKLISPTQAEKLLAEELKKTRTRNRFLELVHRSPAKRVLAPEDDKREAVGATIDALPDIPDEDDGL